MRAQEFARPKKEFVEIFKKFLPLAMRIIGLKSLPKIVFEKEIYSPDQPTFGQYVNNEHILYVGLSNRHPNDILRTLAHELVHYKQDIEHKLNDMSGATGSPEENQANSVAGVVMRMFNKKYPEYLKVKPFIFENVDLDQALFEGPSLSSTLKSIVTNSEPIAQLYERLKAMAKNWVHNNGHLKGFQRNAAGQSARWFNDFYFNRLQNELYSLVQQAPKHSAPLKSFLKNATENREKHITFIEISERLPSILFNIGKNINDDSLMKFAKNWDIRKKDYEDYLKKIESEDSNNNDTDIDNQPRDNFLGRQNAQVEEIVNNILRNLPNRVAGEIRNAIARSPNKLQALQQELARRNIQGLTENFADGRNPQDKGDSARHGIKKGMTIAQLKKIRSSNSTSPRKKQLAHWQINMRQGRKK